MDEKLNQEGQDQTSGKKKVYTPPALTVYGKISDLTMSGGTGQKENMGGKRP